MVESTVQNPVERQRMRAYAHPIRVRILSMLTGEALTAGEMAARLGMSQPAASYHVRHLASAGLLECVGEERVRGGRAKKYRYCYTGDFTPATGDAGTAGNNDEARYARVAQIRALATDVERRLLARDRGYLIVADAEVWIDSDVWGDLTRRLEGVLAEMHEAARPAGTDGAKPVSVSVVAFDQGRR
jgi:DNA-binding transcriptional ArsR family regulator